MPYPARNRRLASRRRVVQAGLVSEYRFNERTGQTIMDWAGGFRGLLGSSAGTDANDPAWTASGLSFTSANSQYATRVGNPGGTRIHLLGAAVIASSTTHTIAGRWGSSTATRTWLLQVLSNNTIQFACGNGTALGIANGAGPSVGSWFWFDAYMDGTNVGVRASITASYATAALSGSLNDSGTFAFGRNPDGGSAYFNGSLGYFLQYQRVLRVPEITWNHTVIRAAMAARGVILP